MRRKSSLLTRFAMLVAASVCFMGQAPASAGKPLSALHLGMHLHALAVVGNGSAIVFATHGATAISRDGGRTFIAVPQLAGMDGMEVATAQSGRVIAVAGHSGALISHDGGFSWSNLLAHLPVSSNDAHGLGIDESDPNRIVVYIAGQGVFETRDGGASWSPRATPKADQPMGTAVIHQDTILIPDMTMMPTMDMAGILRSSDDGKHWSVIDRDVGGMSLVRDPERNETIYFSGGSATLYVSTDDGKSWSKRAIPAAAEVVAPSEDGSLYAAGYPDQHGILWRSRDDGATWTQVSQ